MRASLGDFDITIGLDKDFKESCGELEEGAESGQRPQTDGMSEDQVLVTPAANAWRSSSGIHLISEMLIEQDSLSKTGQRGWGRGGRRSTTGTLLLSM
jgi:hypothetical protein